MKNKLHMLFTAAILLCSSAAVNAQAVNAMPFQASMDTFQPITGTVVDYANADDVMFSALPIGFTFNYGGGTFTTFNATTNGWMGFGASSFAAYFNILSGSTNNVISPFGGDLQNAGAGSNLSYMTVGTAPNRMLCVQWLNYRYFGNMNGNLNFQVWLYENSDCVRFVYGNMTTATTFTNFQLGLRGSSNADYMVLGDTSCNWSLAQPSSAITTNFPVNSMCSMPSGFAFHYGNCSNNTGITFSYLTGKVYNDVNGNAVFDAGDVNMANQILHVMPGNYYVSTNANGNYAFFFMDSSLTYTITPASIQYWTLTTPSPVSVTPLTQSCSGLDFGMQITPGVHDMGITCPLWTMQPGGGGFLPISYHNYGTTVESDTITLVMDPLLSYISCTPAPDVINGQTLKWAFSNLNPNQGGSLWVHLGCSSSAVIGNYTNSTLSIGPAATDVNLANNTVLLHQLLSAAFDPNFKAVSPAGEIPAGTDLHYTIHFQNTGNAAATTVIIRDTLDAGVDPMSLLIDGSSHPVIFSMSGNGIATFTFYGIMLPDSGSNWAGSQGFVSYTVRTLSSLASGTNVNNTAGIYFDINPVVMTNTTNNVIANGTGISNLFEGNLYSIMPNPSNGVIKFNTGAETATVQILSIDGKLLMQNSFVANGDKMDISSLPSGMYLVMINSKRGSETLKLVKE